MMTFSVVWVVLAATVTVIAMMRRAAPSHNPEVRVRQSGRALIVVAVIYSLVLLVGFLYVGWQHGLELMK